MGGGASRSERSFSPASEDGRVSSDMSSYNSEVEYDAANSSMGGDLAGSNHGDLSQPRTVTYHRSLRQSRLIPVASKKPRERLQRRADRFEQNEIQISKSGFSRDSITISARQLVTFTWSTSEGDGYNVVQVVHDGEGLCPVIGGIYSGAPTMQGHYEVQFNLKGEYKFISNGLALHKPLSITVREHRDIQAELTSTGFQPRVIHVEIGDRVKWTWNQLQAGASVFEATLCRPHNGLRPKEQHPSRWRTVPCTSGTYSKKFSQSGLFYIAAQTESQRHLCVVHVHMSPKEYRVKVLDREFEPSVLRVEVGDRVWWTWDKFKCKQPHCIQQIEAPSRSALLVDRYVAHHHGFSWPRSTRTGLLSHVFDTPGVFYYVDGEPSETFCEPGIVVVLPRSPVATVRLGAAGPEGLQPDVVFAPVSSQVWWEWPKTSLSSSTKDSKLRVRHVESIPLNPSSDSSVPLDWRPCSEECRCQALDEESLEVLQHVGCDFFSPMDVGVHHFSVRDVTSGMEMACSVVVQPATKTHTIRISGGDFVPRMVHIHPGDSVCWEWAEVHHHFSPTHKGAASTNSHNVLHVTAQGRWLQLPSPLGFCSGPPRDPPGAFVHTFITPGVFYFASDGVKEHLGVVVATAGVNIEKLALTDNTLPEVVSVPQGNALLWLFPQLQYFDMMSISPLHSTPVGRPLVPPRRALVKTFKDRGMFHLGNSARAGTSTPLTTVLVHRSHDFHTVHLHTEGFSPPYLIISQHHSVCWTWKYESDAHNVILVAPPGEENDQRPMGPQSPFTSGPPQSNTNFFYTFNEVGLFCVTSEGFKERGKIGVILVKGQPSKTPPPEFLVPQGEGSSVGSGAGVQLRCSDSSAQIYYTVNGSLPELHTSNLLVYNPKVGIVWEKSGLTFIRAVALSRNALLSDSVISSGFHVTEEQLASSSRSTVPQLQFQPWLPTRSEWEWHNLGLTIHFHIHKAGCLLLERHVAWTKPLDAVRMCQVLVNGVPRGASMESLPLGVLLSGFLAGKEYSLRVRVYPQDSNLPPLDSNHLKVTFPAFAWKVEHNRLACRRQRSMGISASSVSDSQSSDNLSSISETSIKDKHENIASPPDHSSNAPHQLDGPLISLCSVASQPVLVWVVNNEEIVSMPSEECFGRPKNWFSGTNKGYRLYMNNIPLDEVYQPKAECHLMQVALEDCEEGCSYAVRVGSLVDDLRGECFSNTLTFQMPLSQDVMRLEEFTRDQCGLQRLLPGPEQIFVEPQFMAVIRPPSVEEDKEDKGWSSDHVLTVTPAMTKELQSFLQTHAMDSEDKEMNGQCDEVELPEVVQFTGGIESESESDHSDNSTTQTNNKPTEVEKEKEIPRTLSFQEPLASVDIDTEEEESAKVRKHSMILRQVAPTTVEVVRIMDKTLKKGHISLKFRFSPNISSHHTVLARCGVVCVGRVFHPHFTNSSHSQQHELGLLIQHHWDLDTSQLLDLTALHNMRLCGLLPGEKYELFVEATLMERSSGLREIPSPDLVVQSEHVSLQVQGKPTLQSFPLFVHYVADCSVHVWWNWNDVGLSDCLEAPEWKSVEKVLLYTENGQKNYMEVIRGQNDVLLKDLIPGHTVTLTVVVRLFTGQEIISTPPLLVYCPSRPSVPTLCSQECPELPSTMIRISWNKLDSDLDLHHFSLFVNGKRFREISVRPDQLEYSWDLQRPVTSKYFLTIQAVAGPNNSNTANKCIVCKCKSNMSTPVLIAPCEVLHDGTHDSPTPSLSSCSISQSGPSDMPSAPRNLRVVDTSCHEVLLRWDPVPLVQRPTHILVVTRSLQQDLGCSEVHHSVLSPDVCEFLVAELLESHLYAFRVVVCCMEEFLYALESTSPIHQMPRNEQWHSLAQTVARHSLDISDEAQQWLPSSEVCAATSGCKEAAHLRVTDASYCSLELHWQPATASGSCRVLRQIMYWWSDSTTDLSDETPRQSEQIELEPNRGNVMLQNLVPATRYRVSLHCEVLKTLSLAPEAVSEMTRLPPLELLCHTTPPCHPPELYIIGVTEHSVTVSWDPPQLYTLHPWMNDAEPRGPAFQRHYLRGYKLLLDGEVVAQLPGFPSDQPQLSNEEENEDLREFTIENLTPGSSHSIRLAAFTKRKKRRSRSSVRHVKLLEGSWSDCDVAYSPTLEVTLPDSNKWQLAVRRLQCTVEMGSESLYSCIVHWRLQPSSKVNIAKVNFLLEALLDGTSHKRLLSSSGTAKSPFKGRVEIPLDWHNTLYTLEVTPKANSQSPAPPPQRLYFRTPGPPEAPHLHLLSVTGKELGVEWTPPRFFGAVELVGFQLHVDGIPVGPMLSSAVHRALLPCSPDRHYRLHIVAHSSHEVCPTSVASNTLYVNTTLDAHFQAKSAQNEKSDSFVGGGLRVVSRSDSHLEVDWSDCVSHEAGKNRQNSYQVVWDSLHTAAMPLQANSCIVSGEHTRYRIESCAPGLTYVVRVARLTPEGHRVPLCRSIEIQTCAPLDTPVLTLKSCTLHEVILCWGRTQPYGDTDLAGFQLFRNGDPLTTLGPEETSFTYSEGHWCEDYSFQVKALCTNSKYHSRKSKPLVVHWPGYVPSELCFQYVGPVGRQLTFTWSEGIRVGDVELEHFYVICKDARSGALLRQHGPFHPASREATVELVTSNTEVSYHLAVKLRHCITLGHSRGSVTLVPSQLLAYPPPLTPVLSATVLNLTQRRSLEEHICDLANKRDDLLQERIAQRKGLLHSVPYRITRQSTKRSSKRKPSKRLETVESELKRLLSLYEQETGQLRVRLTWQNPETQIQSRHSQATHCRLLVNGMTFGQDVLYHQGEVQLTLPVPSSSETVMEPYRLRAVAVVVSESANSVALSSPPSNEVVVSQRPFLPFMFTNLMGQGPSFMSQLSLEQEHRESLDIFSVGLFAQNLRLPMKEEESATVLDLLSARPIDCWWIPQSSRHVQMFCMWHPDCWASLRYLEHFAALVREKEAQCEFCAIAYEETSDEERVRHLRQWWGERSWHGTPLTMLYSHGRNGQHSTGNPTSRRDVLTLSKVPYTPYFLIVRGGEICFAGRYCCFIESDFVDYYGSLVTTMAEDETHTRPGVLMPLLSTTSAQSSDPPPNEGPLVRRSNSNSRQSWSSASLSFASDSIRNNSSNSLLKKRKPHSPLKISAKRKQQK